MSTQQQLKKVNPLRKLEEEVAAVKSVRDLMKIDVLVDRYVANYEAGTGRTDGRSRFEREAFAFMELANNKPEIMNCDRFSIFAGLIKAASYGLSFSSGKLSVYPRGGKLVVEPDAHGKRELLGRMPTIKRVEEGVVVFNDDEFLYDDLNKKVIKHVKKFPVPKASEETVQAAYCQVVFADGSTKEYVLSLEELKLARAKSKMNDGGELWKTFYGEACKKSTYNRAFKILYEIPDTAVLFKQWEGKEDDYYPESKPTQQKPAADAKKQASPFPDDDIPNAEVVEPEKTSEPEAPAQEPTIIQPEKQKTTKTKQASSDDDSFLNM